MSEEQRLLAAAAAIVGLLAFWFGWMAVRAVRNRRPHGKAVTRAAQQIRELDATVRPDQLDLTEHVAWLVACEPRWEGVADVVGRRGYLALTRTHLIFVPYHRAEPVVLDRDHLVGPRSKYKKVWTKARGSFTLDYAPSEAQPEPHAISFKVRQPYTWLYKFGFRSGLADDPFS
ncbi:MAG: hypothetical protein HYX32_08145 [Actinobacteria bacterium]|nr:hypothetical protein [Actinomycetota bacterium]